MTRYISLVIKLLSLALLVSSCDKNSVSSATTGQIIGTVELVDSNCSFIADRSGVMVQLEGTNFSGISDRSGNWAISNVPAGYYDLLFTKQGYGYMSAPYVGFVGAGTMQYNYAYPSYPPLLAPISTLKSVLDAPTTTQISSTPLAYFINFVVHPISSSGSPVNAGCVVFAGPSAHLDPNDTTSLSWEAPVNNQNRSPAVVSMYFAPGQTSLKALKSGDTAYAIAYSVPPCQGEGKVTYYGSHTGNHPRYPTFGTEHSAVVKFVIP